MDRDVEENTFYKSFSASGAQMAMTEVCLFPTGEKY